MIIIQKHLDASDDIVKIYQLVDDNGDTVDFNGPNATDLSDFKAKITVQVNGDGEINNVEITVLSKHLSNFRRTLEMP